MGEIVDEAQASPPHESLDDNGVDKGLKRARNSINAPEDDDEEETRERRKIEIKFIQDKSRRHITFSKRKAGIMKKAYELSVLTGTQVLLLVVSETGLVYTFTTPKLQPLVTKTEGKNLIQACLNAPEAAENIGNGMDNGEPADESDEPQGQQGGPPAPMQQGRSNSIISQGAYAMSDQQQQAINYQAYLQTQPPHAQQQAQNLYPMPPQAMAQRQ